MILGNLPALVRLSVCLLFSVSLHGGLAFYDWAASPVETQLTDAPVTVSLVPASKVTPSSLNNLPQPAPLPTSTQKQSRSVAAKKPIVQTNTISKVIKKEVSPLPKQFSAAKPVERVKTEPELDGASDDMICMQPQKMKSAGVPAQPEEAQTVVEPEAGLAHAEAVSQSKQVTAQKNEDGALANESTFSQDLVQATPNYRNNPLPDYPYQARLKHWEGVVWLLVDVSAEGLVDDLRVEKSCGHRLLDRTASRTVRRWQFTPAKRAGLPVLSQVRIPVRFDLEDD